MKIELLGDILHDYEKASSREWIETNGLGGWASSSLSGANTRSYHGLFVVATDPPVGRMVLLSKLEENIFYDNQTYELSCNQFPGSTCNSGLKNLTSFTKEFFPSFQFNIGPIEIKKTIAAIHDEDTITITYEVTKAVQDFSMELKPFVAYRNYHALAKANNSINNEAIFGNGLLQIKPYADAPQMFIYAKDANFKFKPEWFHYFEYSAEQERGLNFQEDLFSHGSFILNLKKGSKVSVVISTSEPRDKDAFKLQKIEKQRRESLFTNLSVKDDFTKTLALAADQFLVKRGQDLKTIIAGYHWFSDWGRDTMISLPGLCLVTNRFEEAKKILLAFAKSMDRGMIPNRFPDVGEEPEYNTVDATLWFFIAIKKYLDYSEDQDFVLNNLLPCLEEIVKWHDEGTRYNIHVDRDGLIYAGQHGVQLTWMDAKVGDWVVTPRQGKAVEINALWYNSILIMAEFYGLKGDANRSKYYLERAFQIKNSFLKTFLRGEGESLYDCVDGIVKDASIRPNQLFAISLPYPLLDKKQASAIIKIVEDKLLTPYGLRSLASDDPKFIPTYQGDQLSRDGAYHQGTVWSWLLGPYFTAKIKVEGEKGRQTVTQLLKVFERHFYEAGIGTVSEIFDGFTPYKPKGCIAQAWGVAEVLRAYLEDVCSKKKEKKNSKINEFIGI